MAEPRVVSLIASSTEIISALGFADLLVARSHECDYPREVLDLPCVTEAKLRTDVSSLEIDRQVRNILRAGLSVYRVDADRLRELNPQVIVTQDHCEVCAVSTKDLEAAACDFLGPDVRIVSLKPNSLRDVFDGFRDVAEALGEPQRAERLITGLNARIHAIGERAGTATTRPRVAFIEWIDPLMAGGNWVPELIDIANGEDLLGKPGEHSGWITFDALSAADPDIIIVAPCGFDRARTEQEMPALIEQCGWSWLRAVRERNVFIADGNAYFNRPGPRLVESLETLAEIIHPELFDFNHENSTYRRFT